MASKGKGIASYGKRKQRDDDDNGGAKKGRDRSVLQFFEDAAVDDDGPDSDSDDSFFDEDFLDELMAKVKKEPGRDDDDHHRTPFFPKEEELSGDELEKMLEERYRGSRYVKFAEDDNESRRSTDKDFHLPPGEPAIWKVKCKVGREKNTVFCLMQKFVDLKALGTKLQIISAFAAEHIKGFIFVEAEKQSDVVMACNQLADVYFTLVTQVPSDEVAKLLVVRKRHSEVKEGTWARVKNGIYRGDLAQVVAVNNERKRATVKLIPRIDLQALTEKYGVGGRLKRAKGSVPAARLISSTDLEEFRPLIQYRRDRDTGQMFEFLDSLMLKDGFLYKKISIDSLSFWGVNPSQDELEKFTIPSNDGTDNVEWLSQLYGEQKKNSFVKAGKGGDKGGGKGEGSSGSQEQSSFEVHDLVHFGKREFGMVIGLDKDESYKILKEGSDGPVTLNMGQKDLKFVPLEKKFTALDHRMKTISINDTVKILDGLAKDRQGIVKQIYRGIIFLYDENDLENAYFCSKSQLSQKVKHSDSACHGKDEGGPSSFEEAPSSPKSPLSPKKPWQARDNFEDRADKERMFSVGQSLRIRIGPLKGYMCRVLAIRFSDVTVKLDSQQKVFTVKREHLSEVQGKSSTSLTRDDPESSSPFKPFDLLGSEGNANEWLHQASGSAHGGGWNVGGSSTERSAWPAFPSVASLQVGTTATDMPSSVTNDDSKEDTAWLSKVAVDNNSSQAGGWGSSSGGWGKSKEPVADQGSSWNAAGDLSQEKADTTATNNWGSSSGGWGKAKESGGDPGESWNAGGFSLSQEKMDTNAKNNWNPNSGGWEKAKEPGGCQGGSWNAGASGCGIQKIAAGDSWGEKKNSSDIQGWGSSVGASQSEALTTAETHIGWGQSQGEKASGGTWAKAKALEDKEDPWGKVVDKQGAKDSSAKQIGWGSSTNKPSDGNGWGTSSGGMGNSQEENSEAGWKASGGWKSSEDGGNSSWGGSGGNNSWGKSKNFENDGFSRGQGSSGRGRGRDGRGRGRGRSFDKGDDYQGWNKSNEADKDGGGPGGWSSERSSSQAGWNSASFGSSSWGQKDDTQTDGSDDTWGKAANIGNKNLGASKGWKNSTSTQSWGGQGNSGQTSEANATDGWNTTTSSGWSKGEDMGQGKSWGKDFGSEGGESWSKSSGNNSWTCDNDQGQGFGGRRGRGFRAGRDQSGRGFRGGRGESGRGFRGGRDDFGRGGGGRSFGRGGRNGGEGGSFNNRNNGGSWSKGRWGTDGAGEDRSWKKPSEGGSSWGGGTDGGGDAKDWGKPSEDSSWGVKSSGVGGSWVAGGGGSDNKVGGDGNIRSKGWSSGGSSSWGGGGDGNNKMSGDSSDGSKGWNSGGNSRGGRGSSGGGFVGGSGSWGGGSDKQTGIDENNGSKGWNSGGSSWGGGGSNGGSGSWGGGSDKKTGIDENNGSKGWNSGGSSWGGGGSNGGDSRGDGGNGGGFWGDNNRAGGGGSSWGSGQGGGSSWGKSSSGQSSDAGGGWGK